MKEKPVTGEMIAKGAADASADQVIESAIKSQLLALMLSGPLEQLPKTREAADWCYVSVLLDEGKDWPSLHALRGAIDNFAAYLRSKELSGKLTGVYIYRYHGEFRLVCEHPKQGA